MPFSRPRLGARYPAGVNELSSCISNVREAGAVELWGCLWDIGLVRAFGDRRVKVASRAAIVVVVMVVAGLTALPVGAATRPATQTLVFDAVARASFVD